MWTKERKLEWQRERRKIIGNSDTKKYEKTKPGFLMRLYRNMSSRVKGIQKHKYHLYKGKEILPKEQFYKWAKEEPLFHYLFAKYEESGFNRELAPSVDRIDSSIGYTIDNIHFTTTHENSMRATIGRRKVR